MTKQLVKLRQRKMPSGTISLYLDLSINGKRKFEYLKLYLKSEAATAEDKRSNKETLRLAQAVQAKRIVEIQNNEYGFKSDMGNLSFITYFDDLASQKGEKTKETWSLVSTILKTYCSPTVSLSQVTKDFLEGFKLHLDKHKTWNRNLSRNSKWLYFSKIIAAINQAERDNLINSNPARLVKNYKKEEVERVYITIEELKLLITAPFRPRWKYFRNAFLFSCLTGLRWSDIESLKWGMVLPEDDGTCRLHFKQEKTEGQEYLVINKQAVQLMGKPGKLDEAIFRDITYSHYVTTWLTNWAKVAGIDRHLTFHSARHSFAIMMIEIDTDLYVLSKLLGHKEIATTQIYAKVRDKKKKEAINKIPDFSITS